MGMFGSRTQTAVSSVVYNMAGDENDRPNYLKTTVFGSILREGNNLSQDITNSYLNGPAIKFRSFARWSRRTGYTDTVGLVTGSLLVGNSIDNNVLAEQIPHAANETVQIQSVNMGEADSSFWADQWILLNHPDRINEEYRSDMIGTTINIYFNEVLTYSFEPSGFDQDGRYIYAAYILSADPVSGDWVTGPEVELAPGEPWPSVSGWDVITDTTTNTDLDLDTTVETVITYSNGDPGSSNTTESTRTETYELIHREYGKEEFMGDKPGTDSTYSIASLMFHDQTAVIVPAVVVTSTDEDIGGGVIKTTKVTTTTENLVLKRKHRTDTQETIQSEWSPAQMFIYQMGTGNAVLDAMFAPPTGNQIFYPYIPFRVDNQFISPTFHPNVYDESKKALRKATTNGKYDDIIKKIADNESIGDIDYAYAVFGVSLNVKEVACREYIYRFFQSLLVQEGVGGDGSYNAWKLEWNAADRSMDAWYAWKTAQSDSSNPLFGTPEPAKLAYPAMQTKQLKIRSDVGTAMDYHISIEWSAINETVFTGVGKEGAKQGDLWFTTEAADEFNEKGYVGGVWGTLVSMAMSSVQLYWQDSPTTYRRLSFRGLRHYNFVYKGKHIIIDAKEALEDTEESGFIIPLHEGVYRAMPLKSSTQMATACMFLMFNCYKTTKKKWYQTGIFAVVIIIIIIVITIFFPPAGAGAAGGGGLLGANAAVGAAIGLTGAAAIIVGAIANAIAAMLLVNIIQRGAVAIFGDKLGTIIGAIAAVIALNVGTAMANGQTMAQGFGNMMQADNLLALTSTSLNAYSNYVNVSTQSILEKTNQLLQDYKVESEAVSQAYADAFGVNKGVIDPLSLTDAVRSFTYTPESRQSFLDRTLMLGSDIADMSLNMLTNFADLTLSTNLQT
ncbi:hypothetical protein [Xanthomonas virus PB119]|nr:hypothetical protein [Xanthomonas virus PB119]